MVKGVAESLVFVVSWLKTVVQSKAALNAVVVLKRVIAADCKDPEIYHKLLPKPPNALQ